MANKVTIDVEARFIDNVTGGAKSASDAFDKLEKEANDAAKAVDSFSKKKATPSIDANTSKFKQAIDDSDKKLTKFGKTKAEAKLGADDKATSVIDKVLNKLKNLAGKTQSVILSAKDSATSIINSVINKVKTFAGNTYSAMIKVRDSEALASIRNITSGAEGLTKKTWTAIVTIKDLATAPLQGIKNMLFSMQSLVIAITAGVATQQLVLNPISVADAYSSANISFSTLLGASQGQQMMDDLDAFAAATPFNTSNVISNAQKMLAMGWDADNIITDMAIIGNAAAATGKLDQGLESIVRALSQIKTKGRLSTEELNQLAEAGIAAKAMLAEELGYGTGDSGIAAMTKDLEDGLIASDVAIEALLAGMQKYNGMMDSMANETVEGLKSQIQDAFEINVIRKWGQGLQDGAKRGLGAVVSMLDEAEAAMASLGDTAYEVGKTISNWAADKLENAIKRISDITSSYEFQNATLGEKISMLWNGVIVDPLNEWWEGGGREKTAETAGKIGAWMGEAITEGLLTLFGMTEILDDETAEELGKNGGMSIAQSFAQGFKENFDGAAITDAFVDAISNIWGALPTWAQVLLGGYAAGKVVGGVGNLVGGVANLTGNVMTALGGFGIASSAYPILTSSGSGILGVIGNTGVALGASTTAGALLAGSAGIAGGVAGGASIIKGAYDIYRANRAEAAGDITEAEARRASANGTLNGVAAGAMAGAAIGSIIPGLGTALGALVGAGVGGVSGWLIGNNNADEIRAARYESEEMQAALKDSEKSAEELAEAFKKAKWENATKHFGDISLSMSEIKRMADQIVWGEEDIRYFEDFSSAVQMAEASLQTMKTAAQQVDRWMWKASLGVEFDEDEKASIVASFDEYINSAKSYVENKHYEFTAAVSLLVDVESEEGKNIIESGNAFYTALQEQLDSIGAELSSKVNIALEDGVITLDEQAEIINLQQQIAEITTKLANAEQQAELALIEVKFGQGNMDYESFENFMAQMQTTIQARMSASDKAFTTSVSSLYLQLEEGAISQEQFDAQIQTIIDGYNTSNAQLKADIKDVELNIIGDAYAQELGDDAVADLNNALQYAIDNGIDPIEITDENLSILLNLTNGEELSAETADNIRSMLSGVSEQLGLVPVDTNVEAVVNEMTVEGADTESVTAAVDDTLPEAIQANVPLTITGEKQVEAITLLAEEFGVPATVAGSTVLELNAAETLCEQLTILQDDFGIEESYAWETLVKLTGNPEYNTITPTAADFGIPSTLNHTITINVTGVANYTGGDIDESLVNPSNGFRGGIFGGTGAMGSYARGGIIGDNIPGFSNGGIVRGGSQLIEVAEEGSPEMVIPLSSQRRGRALKLWAQAGNIMGVPGFARGGIVGGNIQDEGIRFNAYGSNNESAGGRNVQVDVGGVTLEVNVSGSDREGIVEAIKAQAGELADYFVGVIADALETEFENTPVRGGAV